MTTRKISLVNDEIYHIFDRSVDQKLIFEKTQFANRFLFTTSYYLNSGPPCQLAAFLRWEKKKKEDYQEKMREAKHLVEIIAYCLMPNHFHFILKQLEDGGIVRFIRLVENSFAKYYNIINKRKGPLFEGPFKSILVENDEQLIHLSRYIHLNPYSAGLASCLEEIIDSQLCSLGEYLGRRIGFTVPKPVLDLFPSRQSYFDFVANQADYQRSLQLIKERFED